MEAHVLTTRHTGVLLIGVAALIASVGYAVGQIREASNYEAHAFEIKNTDGGRWDWLLIDKRTGRTWAMGCDGKSVGQDCSGMFFWWEMYVDGVTPANAPAAKTYHLQHPGAR
jgi:hypothetical protein